MLTLITDASYGAPGKAGWAAWAKADGVAAATRSGVIEMFSVTNSSEAELVAAVYALSFAVEYGPGHDVLLQSDCTRALRMLCWHFGFPESPHTNGGSVGRKPLEPSKVEKLALQVLRALLHGNPTKVIVRHVKGHSRRSEGRHGVNHMCDRLAKGHMNAARGGACP